MICGRSTADVCLIWSNAELEGVGKPDRGLFEIAARRCGVSLADGGWMVGDRLGADIAGGRSSACRWASHSGPISATSSANSWGICYGRAARSPSGSIGGARAG
ncbi:HAD hydrolase-like protein [Nonomuraea sp. NPDC049152]|uniref:HAD hydrolase-like protein n=1 Tax=Nonomuraea sp. NPDC049152 TaxID=3154350 RepID=UPI0033E4169F